MTEAENVSLREYLEKITELRFMAHQSEHILLDRAISKASDDMNTRLAGMNEFRHQLEAQGATFVSKEMFYALQDKMSALDGKLSNFVPREALRPITQFQDRFWGIVAGITVLNALLTGLIVMVLKKG